MAEMSDDDILAELGVTAEPKKVRARTPREERIIAGFEDILKFREEHGRAPQHGEGREIFERIYAVRLDQLRALPECRLILQDMDAYGLLDEAAAGAEAAPEELDDSELLAELGVDTSANDITQLRHVRSYEEKQAAEEIANRKRCEDFATFKPLFDRVQRELDTGVRQTREFVKDAGMSKAAISKGEFFVLGGQITYVAEVGEPIRAPNGENDARLRVIYSNATESDLLLRSLQRALYKDEGGRRITEPTAGPLFASELEEEDLASGTIYVLQSKSDHPTVAEHRSLIHKIGVTSGTVEARIAGAAHDATYLLADVEIVATYKLYNINRAKLEKLFHRVLAAARLDLTILDRFGHPVQPREWFLVPLQVIDEIVERIKDGRIVDFEYEPNSASLKPIK